MKKAYAVLVCVLLAVTMVLVAFATQSVQMTVSTQKKTVTRGQVVHFSVSMTQLDNTRSAIYVPEFDTNVFEFVEGECKVSGAYVANFGEIAGVLAGSFASDKTSGITVSGEIFTFSLKVKDSAPLGSTVLNAQVNARNTSGDVATQIDPLNLTVVCAHDWSRWQSADDNGHTRTCALCDAAETAAHLWDAGTVTLEPTCRDTGVKTYTCADCKATEEEVLPVTEEHTYGQWTDAGEMHQQTCTLCEKVQTAAHVAGEEIFFGETTHWYSCICGAKVGETAHVYNTGMWETDAQNHWHSCVCGSKADLAAHTFTEQLIDAAHKVPDDNTRYYYDCAYCDTIGAETFAVTARGDMNCDGKVDEDDAIYLLQHVLMPDLFPLE